MDADSLIHIARPEDGFDRLYPVSMGRYGPTVAVPRILATYRRLGIRQSFFIPGWCLETYPDAVEAILSDGHEIGHHGWIHEDPVTTRGPSQAEAFEKALDAHRRICGGLPRGYRAPVYNVTQQVIDLTIRHGLRYDSSLMADDIPYRMTTAEGGLWRCRCTGGNDDWPPFAHYAEIGYMMQVREPSAGLAGFWEEFEAQYEAGGFFMLIVHPFLTGPAGPLAAGRALAGGDHGDPRGLVRQARGHCRSSGCPRRPGARHPYRTASLLRRTAEMSLTEIDRRMLCIAYEEALTGFEEGGCPIGAVLARSGTVVSQGRNRACSRRPDRAWRDGRAAQGRPPADLSQTRPSTPRSPPA